MGTTLIALLPKRPRARSNALRSTRRPRCPTRRRLSTRRRRNLPRLLILASMSPLLAMRLLAPGRVILIVVTSMTSCRDQAGKWYLCNSDSESNAPEIDAKKGEFTFTIFAQEGDGTSNTVDTEDVTSAIISIGLSDECTSGSDSCDLNFKDGQSLSKIYGGAGVMVASAMIVIAAAITVL